MSGIMTTISQVENHISSLNAEIAVLKCAIKQLTAKALIWIKPPWRDRPLTQSEEEMGGCWPWCGDAFLAAVPVKRHHKEPPYEYVVLQWTETGLELANGDYCDWSESDIEWIARIPDPVDNVLATKEEVQ